MKAVVGFFTTGGTRPAHDALIATGFLPENVTELNAIEEVPDYLEGEPERTASLGWLNGAVLGALIGAVAGWLLFELFNLSLPGPLLVVFLLVSAGAGAAIGGYLLSIYSVRADTKLDMDIREALSEGKSLLMVHAHDNEVSAVARIMKRQRSEKVETHMIPIEEPESEELERARYP